MEAYSKGRNFEVNVWNKLASKVRDETLNAYVNNPYTFTIEGKTFHAYRNHKAENSHETDIYLIDDYAKKLFDQGKSDAAIGKRSKGVIIRLELKNYEKNVPISVANELTGINYLMKPNRSLLITNNNKGVTHWLNFKKNGIEHVNESDSVNATLDYLLEQEEYVKNTIKKNKKFYKKNYEMLKKRTVEKIIYKEFEDNYLPRSEKKQIRKKLSKKFDKSKKLIISTTKDKITLSKVREAFGRIVNLNLVDKDAVIVMYYNPKKGVSKHARAFTQMINSERRKYHMPNLFTLAENKNNQTVKEKLKNQFKNSLNAGRVRVEYINQKGLETANKALNNSFQQEVEGIVLVKRTKRKM